MKRSEINALMADSLAFLREMKFRLPPFATWSPAEWRAKGPKCREIVGSRLGRDITDICGGDLPKVGLVIFTIRNGTFAELRKALGNTYAEKILIV